MKKKSLLNIIIIYNTITIKFCNYSMMETSYDNKDNDNKKKEEAINTLNNLVEVKQLFTLLIKMNQNYQTNNTFIQNKEQQKINIPKIIKKLYNSINDIFIENNIIKNEQLMKQIKEIIKKLYNSQLGNTQVISQDLNQAIQNIINKNIIFQEELTIQKLYKIIQYSNIIINKKNKKIIDNISNIINDAIYRSK